MRLIDADELKTAFPSGETIRTESVKATINHMPTAEKKGKWIEEDIHSNWSDWTLYFCSECGRQFKDLEERNFCPNCGAKMMEDDMR